MPPKRRRRFQGLYYHSSPPKVLPMNGQTSNQGRKRRDIDEFAVKLSTIRIWMHEKDIGKLTRIMWAGQGSRLCQQASTNPRVKRFLAAVPYVMNSIKDVHQAVIDNNLETLQANMEPPVPPALITCRDANGLNLIHKAAGLGHTKILEYLIGIWPDGAAETDITGKTPLHWAASHKNNMRCYTLLTQAGCDEETMDYKMKSPTYYRHKPHEIERAFLVYVPEAPRVSPDVATDWEALSEDVSDGGKKLDIKIPDTNSIHGRTSDDSIENTSEVDLNDGLSATEEEQPATPITNENGSSDSVPLTPIKDENEAADEREEGEEASHQNDEFDETTMNDNGNIETAAEVENNDGEKSDEAAVETAELEVDAAEEETNMKTLNKTTTTTTTTTATSNGSVEQEEQRESETTATTEETKSTAESEITSKLDETQTEGQEKEVVDKVEETKEEKSGDDKSVNESKDTSDDKEDEKLLSESEKKEESEEKVQKEAEEEANKEEADNEEIIVNAFAIDPRMDGEVSEVDIEVAQNGDEKEMDDAKEEEINKELDSVVTGEVKLNDSKSEAAEQPINLVEIKENSEETKVINQIIKAAGDTKREAECVGDNLVEELSKKVGEVEEVIEKLKEDVASEMQEAENEERVDKRDQTGNEILKKEKEEANESAKITSKEEEQDKNNIDNSKETVNDPDDFSKEKEPKDFVEKVIEMNNDEDKQPGPSVKQAAEVKQISDKKDYTNENLDRNKIEDNKPELNAEDQNSKTDKDLEKKTTPQSIQPDTKQHEDDPVSNKNENKETIDKETTQLNDKTEKDVKNETSKYIENVKEDNNMHDNDLVSKTARVNGETKNALNVEQQMSEHSANAASEQNSRKMPPRLTTAKVMRGSRNNSAKRNGSAKKKSEALNEGENESEGNIDEDDEDEVQFGML